MTKLVVLVLATLIFVGPVSWAKENNESTIKLSSPLPNLNKLLQQKGLPLKLRSLPLPDNHPQKKTVMKISLEGTKEKIDLAITFSLKFGWLKSVSYQIVIIDQPLETKDGLKFGNISEVRLYFYNNTGQNQYGWATTTKKGSYFSGPEKSLPAAMLADLQRIYDLAIIALAHQDNDSIHQVIHQLELETFFQKHQLVDKNDIMVAPQGDARWQLNIKDLLSP